MELRFKRLTDIAGIKGRGFTIEKYCRASFSVELLNRGVPLEMVALIFGEPGSNCRKTLWSFVKSRSSVVGSGRAFDVDLVVLNPAAMNVGGCAVLLFDLHGEKSGPRSYGNGDSAKV